MSTQAVRRDELRVCVVVPTYNNAATLEAVLHDVLERVSDVIVVNDGSTDATRDILARFPGVPVVTHDANRGKGAALAAGLARAAADGFTHAIAMDSDGQHLASDLPEMLAAARRHPDAIVVGARDLAGRGRRGLKSRVLRANSDFWVWLATGRRVRDSQSGFRAYPLAPVTALAVKCERYDFEIEVLVKALWAGVPVAAVPVSVRYDTGSPSHFRPLRDFLRVARLDAALVAETVFVPPAMRARIHLKAYASQPLPRRMLDIARGVILHESATPARLAACVAVGVACGILPIWGFQMAAAVALAHVFGLSKPLTVAASNISMPFMIPFIVWGSIAAGRLALAREGGAAAASAGAGWTCAVDYIVGSVIFALVAAVVLGAATYAAASVAAAVRRRA